MLSKKLSKVLIFQIIAAVAILALPSLVYTGSYIIADAPAPKEGVEMPPENREKLSEGLFFIVLDGGRRDMMSDPTLMPTLNSMTKNNGTYMDVFTNPLTMTASCVKEICPRPAQYCRRKTIPQEDCFAMIRHHGVAEIPG